MRARAQIETRTKKLILSEPLFAPDELRPEHQQLLARVLREGGVSIIFVLGHDWFYPKFGFSVEQAAEFQTVLKGPHFMALRLRPGPPMSGRLIFPDAFGVPIAEV